MLLLGMSGCPGTENATEVLTGYARTKPDGVGILRLDVPPPGEVLGCVEGWDAPFPRELDARRKTADRLDFFFYPTLYIFDGEGVERFQGAFLRRGDKVGLVARLDEVIVRAPAGQDVAASQRVAFVEDVGLRAAAVDGDAPRAVLLRGPTSRSPASGSL